MVFPLLAHCQDFGVKGGLAIATVSGQGTMSLKPGAQIGAFTKLGGNEPLYFKGELLLTQKGSWNWDVNNLSNISLYYLDIPVMFGIEIIQGLSLNLGFQPSIRLGGSYRYDTPEGRNFINISNAIHKMDYSTLLGAEYIYKTGILIGVRYNHGFIPLQSWDGEFTLNSTLPLNRVLQVYCGIELELFIDKTSSMYSNLKKLLNQK